MADRFNISGFPGTYTDAGAKVVAMPLVIQRKARTIGRARTFLKRHQTA